MRIVAVGAHPDDIELGCGGFLFDHAADGAQVVAVVATNGGAGGDAERRGDETEEAARILGIRDVIRIGLPDCGVRESRELTAELERIIGASDVVLTHYPEDRHPDHRALGCAVRAAARRLRRILFFEVESTVGFVPTLFYPLSESTFGAKQAAIRAHATQEQKPLSHSICEQARSYALFRGNPLYRYAEGFMPGRWELQNENNFRFETGTRRET